jgi:ABC-type sugar transport system permease subunit
METIEGGGQSPLDPLEGSHTEGPTTIKSQRRSWLRSEQFVSKAPIVAALIGALVLAILFGKVRTTIITVVVAVTFCAAIWIGANLLFDQARDHWVRFNTLRFASFGVLLGIVLHGNLLTHGSGEGFLAWIVGPVIGAVTVGAIGFALSQTDDVKRRRAISIGGFAAIGIAIGLLLREDFQPGVDWVATLVYTAVVGLIGAGLAVLVKRPWHRGALVGAAAGWVLGYWGGADPGEGSVTTALVGAVVPALLIGVRLSEPSNPDLRGRTAISQNSRSWIFLGPALLFITVMLVIPTLRTAYLSLFDNDDDFVGLENYGATFADKDSWQTSDWTNMFTSYPFLIGVVLLILAVVVGSRQKKLTGRAVEVGGPTLAPAIVGSLFVAFGVFTAMRGTIINNFWWVVTVTFFSTAIGLAVAVLADQRGGEKIAKSIIFMPMALSLVGASVIWRFVYQTRDTSKNQTGVMNAVWVRLGEISTGSGIGTILGAVFFGVLVAIFGTFLARALVRKAYGRAVVPAVLLFFAGWIFLRYTQIIGGGIGGFKYNEDGTVEAQTIAFVQESPYNNFWLMVILIWIQVGFAMVILSAAIKAVPTEFIEAARIDGATDAQIFWRVTLPQIATTIGVVVTTLIVLIMKVFDIVKVTTNGQFGTQVLANDMFQQAFQFGNTGRGAALAMLIFLSVLPVMYYNIRRMQKEE